MVLEVTVSPTSASRRTASRAVPYAFLAPAIVLFAAVPRPADRLRGLPEPAARSRCRGLGLGKGAREQVFAGLDNYTKALTDPEFWASSVLGAAVYGAILVPTMLGLALLFALLLDSPRARARRFSRIAIFLPYAVPAVIASLLWGFLYLPAVSPFHYAARPARLARCPTCSRPGR